MWMMRNRSNEKQMSGFDSDADDDRRNIIGGVSDEKGDDEESLKTAGPQVFANLPS